MRFPALPHADGGGVPIRRGPRHWAWRLFSPGWHEELLTLVLIIMTVAAGCLLARH
jgi:hypothetical protein